MKNNQVRWIVFGGSIFIIALALIMHKWMSKPVVDNSNTKAGARIYNNLLSQTYEILPNTQKITPFLESLDNNTLLICKYDLLNITPNNVDIIMSFLLRGGKILFINKYFPEELYERLFHIDDFIWTSGSRLPDFVSTAKGINLYASTFRHPSIEAKKYNYLSYGDTDNSVTLLIEALFNKEEQLTYPIVPLTKVYLDKGLSQVSGANFVKMFVGQGELYMHFSPYLFSNYFLAQEEGFDYFNKVFGHFNVNKIAMLRLSHLMDNEEMEEEQRLASTTPRMQYIYSQTMLRNAWYVLLFMGGLLILFKGKRRQRIVPVLANVKNRSQEFIRNISYLYYKTNNYANIGMKLRQNFYIDLNTRYHLSLKFNRPATEQEMQIIALKSHVDLAQVKDILVACSSIEKRLYKKSYLMELYKTIQSFYALEKAAQDALLLNNTSKAPSVETQMI